MRERERERKRKAGGEPPAQNRVLQVHAVDEIVCLVRVERSSFSKPTLDPTQAAAHKNQQHGREGEPEGEGHNWALRIVSRAGNHNLFFKDVIWLLQKLGHTCLCLRRCYVLQTRYGTTNCWSNSTPSLNIYWDCSAILTITRCRVLFVF